MKCPICGRKFKGFGWMSHVQKEKRIHGNDIFYLMKKWKKEKIIPQQQTLGMME